ncbi:[Acyl-carrier-protein] S-malonyltransferase [Paucidesulfovibrio gracilis DSM 16080]|uniref:Malonyl CoA-acyl carrier protein transacylase n=1 Tax=Paucidesulfovibrio gracilis DSM 16080 TaxID=1121449 RepID=A0A1T4X7S1_9BACT|nr:ACP S-malonyltransferase [Paucidesulfovibrio gracilis]SKA85683.1 [Acyl-carrier-protein] S-malonyltransferase [Paucidesulfovibrio gracilis DSM 16080]
MSDIAILFPGQGSQETGMGRDLAEDRFWAMDLWKLAERESGLPLREIYWDGEAKDMADTRALQPALTVVNLNLWALCRERFSGSDAPLAMAGHSLGEFSALAASGALELQDAVRAVTLRGRLMAECGDESQGMAAVLKLDRDAVEEVVEQARSESDELLLVANYNSPAQYVISGRTNALERAAALVKERKGRAVPLAVSGAFHSPLIQEAADEFATFIKGLDWREPTFPVYLNVTARPEADPDQLATVMQRQMTSSVRWIEIMQGMWDMGARRFVEVGPKNVLSKLAGQNLKGLDGLVTQNISDMAQALA